MKNLNPFKILRAWFLVVLVFDIVALLFFVGSLSGGEPMVIRVIFGSVDFFASGVLVISLLTLGLYRRKLRRYWPFFFFGGLSIYYIFFFSGMKSRPTKLEGHSYKYIVLDSIRIKIPADVNITSNNLSNNIYELRPEGLLRHKLMIIKDYAFVTTFEQDSIMHTYMYIIDLKASRKSGVFVNEPDRAHSNAGVFLIDLRNRNIFSVQKKHYYKAKRVYINEGRLFKVEGANFNKIRDVYKLGTDVIRDTTLISFYTRTVAKDSSYVWELPPNWDLMQ